MTTGYSGKPLATKLGLKEGIRALVVGAPQHYVALLGSLPKGVTIHGRASGKFEFIHLFTHSKRHLKSLLPKFKRSLEPHGMLWVSWPKGSSKIESDLNENIVREIGLGNGLVDVKVCAVDTDWSGLKFVYRVKDRGRGN